MNYSKGDYRYPMTARRAKRQNKRYKRWLVESWQRAARFEE